MPQAFYTELPIKHAIIATSSAQELSVKVSKHTAPVEALSTQGYGHTLRLLGDKEAQPTTLVILLACCLFVAYETFRDAPKNAILHFQSGLRILRQWKQRHIFSSEDAIIEQYLEPVFAHIEATFSRSSVSDMKELGDLEYPPPVLPRRFSSLLQVRGKMIELWMYFLSKHPAESIDVVQQLQVLPAWEAWYVKVLQYTRRSGSWSIRDQIQVHLLQTYYDILRLALQCQRRKDEMAWDEHLDDFRKILLTCYDICHNPQTYRHVSNPNDMDFGIIPGVLPPLWLIGIHCRDPIVRRRAAELLRIHHRKCGDTDECSAAAQIETVLRLEEEGIPLAQNSGDIPEDHRVRLLEADLTQPGLLVLTFSRSPHTTRSTVEVQYTSETARPKSRYRLWPIVASMDLAGYQGLVRPNASSCVCKSYGQ